MVVKVVAVIGVSMRIFDSNENCKIAGQLTCDLTTMRDVSLGMDSALIKAAADRKTERCVTKTLRAALLFSCLWGPLRTLDRPKFAQYFRATLILHQAALTVLLLLTVQ